MTSPTTDDVDLVNITPPKKHIQLQAHTDVKFPSGQELGGAMDDAIEKVRVRADRYVVVGTRTFTDEGSLQRDVISPLTIKTRSFAEANPVLFVRPVALEYHGLTFQTFLVIFSVLSIIPIGCFM
jgi:hypothetical protein